jgi:hypothetical protein
MPLTLAVLLVFACASAQTAARPSRVAGPASTTTSVAPAPAASIPTLQAITVTGVVPGPGLWKVSRGGHVLWVLGVVPTLPTGIEWRSNQVAQIIAASRAVLEPPDVKLKVDTNWFGKLFLLLPVYRAQRNPDDKTLRDVLPPALYVRWQAEKQRYFGDDRGIERYRPILAADKLLKRALKQHGLRGNGEVTDAVVALAKQFGARLVQPDTTLEIRHPHAAVKAFATQGPQGIACFVRVLDVVEHKLPVIRVRANAWSVGDLATLRAEQIDDYLDVCRSAITGAGFARELGIDNLPAQVENRWLDAAEAALASNVQSFAVLPMHDVLDPHGYLAALQARGYVVTAPDAADAGTTDPATAASAAPAPASSVR